MSNFMTKMELNDFISSVKTELGNWRKLNYEGIDEPLRDLVECLYHKQEITTIYSCTGHPDDTRGYLMFHCSDETALKWHSAISRVTHDIKIGNDLMEHKIIDWVMEIDHSIGMLPGGVHKWYKCWVIRFYMFDEDTDNLKNFLNILITTANNVLV